VQELEQQLRQANQHREEAALQLQFLKEEAMELRHAKEAAVVDKEQLAVRLERRSQQQQVCKATANRHQLDQCLLNTSKGGNRPSADLHIFVTFAPYCVTLQPRNQHTTRYAAGCSL